MGWWGAAVELEWVVGRGRTSKQTKKMKWRYKISIYQTRVSTYVGRYIDMTTLPTLALVPLSAESP